MPIYKLPSGVRPGLDHVGRDLRGAIERLQCPIEVFVNDVSINVFLSSGEIKAEHIFRRQCTDFSPHVSLHHNAGEWRTMLGVGLVDQQQDPV
jgi:hypothetical protein